jgi:hypothetical protein
MGDKPSMATLQRRASLVQLLTAAPLPSLTSLTFRFPLPKGSSVGHLTQLRSLSIDISSKQLQVGFLAQLTGLTHLSLCDESPPQNPNRQEQLGSALCSLTKLRQLGFLGAHPAPVRKALASLTALTLLEAAFLADRACTASPLLLPHVRFLELSTAQAAMAASLQAPNLQHLALCLYHSDAPSMEALCRGPLHVCTDLILTGLQPDEMPMTESQCYTALSVLRQGWRPTAAAFLAAQQHAAASSETTSMEAPDQSWRLGLAYCCASSRCMAVLPKGITCLRIE